MRQDELVKMPDDFWNYPFNPITGFRNDIKNRYQFYQNQLKKSTKANKL